MKIEKCDGCGKEIDTDIMPYGFLQSNHNRIVCFGPTKECLKNVSFHSSICYLMNPSTTIFLRSAETDDNESQEM